MSEFEELTLEVNLVDNASSQLDVLKKKFDELGIGTQNLENLRRHTSELQKTMKELVETIGKGPEALIKFATGFGAVGVAIGGAVLSVEKLTRALTEMAQESVDLSTLARRIGMDPAETRAMTEALQRQGIAGATASAELEKFAQKMADVQRGAAGVRGALQQLGFEGVTRNMEGLFAQVRKLPDLASQWDAIKEFAKREGEAEAKRSGGVAGVYEKQILDIIGSPVMQTATDSLKKSLAEVDEIRRQNEARALEAGKKQLDLVGQIHTHWTDITRLMGTNIMESKLFEGLKWIDEKLQQWSELLKQARQHPEGKSTFERSTGIPFLPQGGLLGDLFGTKPKPNFNERFGDWGDGGATTPQRLMGDEGVKGFTGPYAPMTPESWKKAADWAEENLHGEPSINLERRDLQEQENAKTRELVNQLKRANAILSGEETPKEGSALKLLSTQMGGLGPGLGAGGGMGRLPGFGGGGGGGGGGGRGTTTDGRPAGPFPPGTHGGPGGPPITPTAPGGTVPATLPGAQAPLGYPTGGFTKVPSLMTPTGEAPPGVAGAPLAGDRIGKAEIQDRLALMIKGSGLDGYVPPDAARYGIKTGSPQEWAALMTNLAVQESGLKSASHGDIGKFGGYGSIGLFQLSPQDAITYGLQDKPFTVEQLKNPEFNAQMAVKIAAIRARTGGIGDPRSGMAKYWAGQGGPLAQGQLGIQPGQLRPMPTVAEQPSAIVTARTRPTSGVNVPSLALDPNRISPMLATAGARPLAEGQGEPAPYRMQGTVTLGNRSYDWASGGERRGAIPYGTHNINIGTGDIGSIGQRIGSVATVGGLGGVIPDPRYPNVPREGVQIHSGSSSELDRLYTEGCFAVPANQWPAFKKQLLAEAAAHPEGLALQINRNGRAIIAPRSVFADASRTQLAGPSPTGAAGPRIETLRTRPVAPPDLQGTLAPPQVKAETAGAEKTDEQLELEVLERAEKYYGITPPPGSRKSTDLAQKAADIVKARTEWEMRGGDFGARARAQRHVFAGHEGVDRSVIDSIAGARMRHRAIGTANIDVDVKGEGQKSVTQTGPFRKVRLSRDTGMSKAEHGPSASSGATGESHDPSLDS